MPDPHGNVASGAQASALTTALRYDGYGQTIATAPTSLPAEAKRWKYQGRLDIAPEGLTTPLYEFSARFYAPGLGTFTQLDPLQGSALDPLTLNRYLYAAANPATLIDPTGHFTMEKDDPSDPCRNRGDAGCGETAVANPGPAGGWKSSTGAVYSSYTGNTNSNNVNPQSTAAGNQTSGGGVPPVAYLLIDGHKLDPSDPKYAFDACHGFLGEQSTEATAAGCTAWYRGIGTEGADEAEKAICAALPQYCQETQAQDILTAVLAVEIILTIGLTLTPGPDEALPGSAAAGTQAALQRIASNLNGLLRREAGFAGTGQPLIIDNSLGANPNRIAQLLRDSGRNAQTVNAIFGKDPKDPAIMQLAEQIGARVVTSDKTGFGPIGIRLDQRIRNPQDAVRYLESLGY